MKESSVATKTEQFEDVTFIPLKTLEEEPTHAGYKRQKNGFSPWKLQKEVLPQRSLAYFGPWIPNLQKFRRRNGLL